MKLTTIKLLVFFPFKILAIVFTAIINRWPSDLFGRGLRYWYYKNKLFSCGKDVKIHDKCIILFPNLIQIGSRSSLARYVELNPGPGQAPCLIIGEDTWIGPYCFFRTANHKFDNLDELFIKQGHDEKKIILGNDIYVGAHCIFLGGTEIGDHSIIAAGSVVSIKVPSYSVVAGNPARVIRKRK